MGKIEGRKDGRGDGMKERGREEGGRRGGGTRVGRNKGPPRLVVRATHTPLGNILADVFASSTAARPLPGRATRGGAWPVATPHDVTTSWRGYDPPSQTPTFFPSHAPSLQKPRPVPDVIGKRTPPTPDESAVYE